MKKFLYVSVSALLMLFSFAFTASALDKSDIMEFFDKAEEISGTYYCDKNYDFGTDDKNQYTFITDGQERYYLNTKMTTDQMYSLLHEYFSDSVIYEITSYKRDGVTSRFIEHEGLVYYDLYDYPLFVGEYPQKEFKIKSVSDNKIVLSMKISRYDKTANYDYVIEKESDSEWRFTKYHYSNDIIIRLEMNNPVTSDSAVYITAAAGLIALCCAVICKKKIKT